MISTEIIDPDEASEVLNDPWVYDRITDDHCPEKMKEYPSDAFYVGGYINHKLVAVSIVHLFELGYKFHYQVLKAYRKYARFLMDESLEIILPIFKKLYCEIPSCYPSVINFAKKSGFREIEVKDNSHLKNGQYFNCHLMVIESWE